MKGERAGAGKTGFMTTCLQCGRKVQVDMKTGRYEPHARESSRKSCRSAAASARELQAQLDAARRHQAEATRKKLRAAQFQDRSGVPIGTLSSSDESWLAARRYETPLREVTPADVVTARRVLAAARAGRVRQEIEGAVNNFYQRCKKRPDLFDPRLKPMERLVGAEGQPEKRLTNRRSPGKKVYFREVLVGKKN